MSLVGSGVRLWRVANSHSGFYTCNECSTSAEECRACTFDHVTECIRMTPSTNHRKVGVLKGRWIFSFFSHIKKAGRSR